MAVTSRFEICDVGDGAFDVPLAFLRIYGQSWAPAPLRMHILIMKCFT